MMEITDNYEKIVDFVTDEYSKLSPGHQIYIDELKNKNDLLESEIGELEDKIEILKELVKTLAELL